MDKVSVVILNWNKPDLTLDCLNSLSKIRTKGFELETIVVDNASSDDSVKKLKKTSHKKLRKNYKLIVNEKNIGYAEGNNAGISEAVKGGADYVLILNNDTEVKKDLIAQLLMVAKDKPLAGMIAPKIYFAKGYEFHKERYKKSELGKVIWAAGGEIDWNNIYGTNRGVDEVDEGQYDKVESIDFASGACVLLKSEALRDTGYFDKRYYMYLEDLELSVRMKKHGWSVVYAPKAIMWHKVAQSSGIGSDLNDYFISRNRLMFGLQYASFRTKLALLRESMKFAIWGRKWQVIGVLDYYFRRFGRGSWK